METKVNCGYHLSVVLWQLWRQSRLGDLLQDERRAPIKLQCLDRPYYHLWFHYCHSCRKEALLFEPQTWERASSICGFARNHNEKHFAARQYHHDRFLVSADISDRTLHPTNRLFLDRFCPSFFNHCVLPHNEELIHLIDVVAQPELTTLAVMFFSRLPDSAFLTYSSVISVSDLVSSIHLRCTSQLFSWWRLSTYVLSCTDLVTAGPLLFPLRKFWVLLTAWWGRCSLSNRCSVPTGVVHSLYSRYRRRHLADSGWEEAIPVATSLFCHPLFASSTIADFCAVRWGRMLALYTSTASKVFNSRFARFRARH